MWMKIVGCAVLVIFFLNCASIVGRATPHMVHHGMEPTDNIKISKNITIHRKAFGRFLGLLKLLKEFHHRKHVYNPYVISKLWRASFEFELNPYPMLEHEIPSNIFFPTDFGINSGGGVVSNINGKPPGNGGLGSNSIDSIFHFGNNEQQSSVTIGGSNQINKGERDEIPFGQNPIIIKDDIDKVSVNDTQTKVAEKSERVLRHAIQPRTDDQSNDEETTISLSTSNTNDPSLAIQRTTDASTGTSIPQTTSLMESSIPETTMLTDTSISQTTASMGSVTEDVTTTGPESSSTIPNSEHTSSMPLPTEWLGYYDFGIHKPEFIEGIEFTTNYPQLVSEDIHYVKYETPFKPSRPDYTANAYTYSNNVFVPLKYYFKR